MLVVVAAHFAVLAFSHGPFCAILALVCLVNALIGLAMEGVGVNVFWTIDGLLKVIVGTAMVAATYMRD